MNISEIIGKNIKLCLDEVGMDMTSYAKLIKVTRQTVTNYMNGTSIIDSERLYITALYFHKQLEWFYEIEHKEPKYTDKEIDDILAENKRLETIFSTIKKTLR